MITVTGATGQLGRLVLLGLLDAGVPASRLRGIVRDPDRAADLADRGVDLRVADYEDRDALAEALAGSTKLYLVSGSEVGKRVDQHRNVIETAADAGVELLVYTSISQADSGAEMLVPEHAATEQLLADADLPTVVLRHNWYLENYDDTIRQAAETGVVLGSTHGGRTWPATRGDFAAAGVAVLTDDDIAPAVLEVDGSQPLTLDALAEHVAEVAGREVTHRDVPAEEHADALTDFGLDEGLVGFVVGIDRLVADGQLDTGGGGIEQLTGSPTTTIANHVRSVLDA